MTDQSYNLVHRTLYFCQDTDIHVSPSLLARQGRKWTVFCIRLLILAQYLTDGSVGKVIHGRITGTKLTRGKACWELEPWNREHRWGVQLGAPCPVEGVS